jgi:DNA-binding MarR family transcriptional regulator
VDEAMAAAGFDDRGFPDGRILRMCRGSERTISQIGRELGVTRQAAGKAVGTLRDRGYVSVDPSPRSGREKVVSLTPTAEAYLVAHGAAVRGIEHELRKQLGADGFTQLFRLLDALGVDEDLRMRDYLRNRVRDL